MVEHLKRYWTFVRPFTLLVPATGMVGGAVIALGADPKWVSTWTADSLLLITSIVAGALLAAALNAFSNGVNQIYDVEMDRINKPHRLLPSRRITEREAWGVSLFFLLVALTLAFWIAIQTFFLVVVAGFLTYIYSAPPLRTKRLGFIANLTVAIPRGTLLMIAGWSTVKDALQLEPWIIGSIFGAYFLGAVTTKDFSDLKGDQATGCLTLPARLGVRKSIWVISPFFILPFLAILPASLGGILTGSRLVLLPLGVVLSVWGAYIVYLLLKTPEDRFAGLNQSGGENHPSWKHMYLQVLLAQSGFALAYLIR